MRRRQSRAASATTPRLLAMLGALAALLLCSPGARAAAVTLNETGSTLMLPLLQSWAQGYAKAAPDAQLAATGTNSGEGIEAVIKGSVLLGASDAYMSDPQVTQNPGLLNIPLAISAQTINTNIPELTTALKLSGPVLAGIYGGKIKDWSDPAIASLNPGVSLPHHAIVPIRRSDTSGDTFIFTQFLAFSADSWGEGPGFGVTIAWPEVQGEVDAAGNAAMLETLAKTPYGIAYIGASFADAVAQAKLATAELQNQAGQFVLPTPATVTAAAAELTPRTPADQRLTLVFAPGANSYPIISYEYAVVRSAQANADVAAALRGFLLWAITPGQGADAAYLDPVHFIALPISIRPLSESQIAKIH